MECLEQWNLRNEIIIPGCDILRSDHWDGIEYTWFVKSNPKRFYRIKIGFEFLRKEGDLIKLLIEHRMKAAEELLWSGIYFNNASLASP
jgi:hypothetical protein